MCVCGVLGACVRAWVVLVCSADLFHDGLSIRTGVGSHETYVDNTSTRRNDGENYCSELDLLEQVALW